MKSINTKRKLKRIELVMVVSNWLGLKNSKLFESNANAKKNPDDCPGS